MHIMFFKNLALLSNFFNVSSWINIFRHMQLFVVIFRQKKEILLKMGVIPDLIFNMNMLTMLKYNTPNGIIGPIKVGPLEYGTGDFVHPLMPKQLK